MGDEDRQGNSEQKDDFFTRIFQNSACAQHYDDSRFSIRAQGRSFPLICS